LTENTHTARTPTIDHHGNPLFQVKITMAAASSSAVNRKRSREDDKAGQQQLTPHTLRLLKIVQEGTQEQASVACAQLESIAATCTPLLLWDLLGRLQACLTHNEWKTRRQAAQALEGIAAYLPFSDQTDFLSFTPSTDEQNTLTVAQVADNLERILSQGRRLYSSCNTKEPVVTSSNVQERIRVQREILAERLGLAGICKIVGNNSLESTITDQDIQVQQDSDINEDDGERVRVLLLLEMQNTTCHKSPQRLLAQSLVYRMFHSNWQLRHGAVLGCLALLRAWKKPDMIFGSWPHDLLARCICLVALDCFGDFSGALVATNVLHYQTGGVVAPVREAAGQLLSVLWNLAPRTIQQETLQLLCRLVVVVQQQHEDTWEVRHGALVALKYISVVTSQVETIEAIANVSLEALRDRSDDVKAIASQILAVIVRQESHSSLSGLLEPLWTALNDASTNMSSCCCLIDLVELFAAVCKHENLWNQLLQHVTTNRQEDSSAACVATLLIRLLHSELLSVKLSILQCVQTLSLPLAEDAAACHSSQQESLKAYSLLVEHLFGTYFDPSLETAATLEDKEEYHVQCQMRDVAWDKLIQGSETIRTKNGGDTFAGQELELRLLSRFFCVKQHGQEDFGCNVRAAAALARFFRSMGEEMNSMLHVAIASYLQSPWPALCEAALLLLGNLTPSMRTTFQSSVHDMLQTSPLCLLADGEGSAQVLVDVSVARLCDEAFSRSIKLWKKDSSISRDQAVETIQDFWRTSIRSRLELLDKDHGKRNSVLSMRINATISGTAMAIALPPKLTPMIRSLMTSLKNEVQTSSLDHGSVVPVSRLGQTCLSVSRLLIAIQDRMEFAVAREKVLGTICEMAMDESGGGSLGANGFNDNGRTPAVQVLRLILVADNDKLVSIRDLPPVWSLLEVLLNADSACEDEDLLRSANLVLSIAKGIGADGCLDKKSCESFKDFVQPLVDVACKRSCSDLRTACTFALQAVLMMNKRENLELALRTLLTHLKEGKSEDGRRVACSLLETVVTEAGVAVCPFVRSLLLVTMSLMTDNVFEISRSANKVFALLVRLAPLAQKQDSISLGSEWSGKSESLIDHLILGKPLPRCSLPASVDRSLSENNIQLRDYQKDGIAWLHFLQTMKLSGGLCDDMGLGKSIQALVGIAVAHNNDTDNDQTEQRSVKSLIVCPCTVVGHWNNEIEKFFPGGSLFQPLCFTGNSATRKRLWDERLESSNVVITSYSVLRSDIDVLEKQPWRYCVLDEVCSKWSIRCIQHVRGHSSPY
jgi:hypothetical protein